MIIGLTGPIGSGKGTVVEILNKLGFSNITFSDILRDELKKRDIEITREALREVGNEIRLNEGSEALSKKIISKIKEQGGKYWVIDGFRNPAEIKEFRQFTDFILLGINAGLEARWERTDKRAREHSPKTFEEFKKVDARDKGVGQEDYGQQGDACFKMADAYIMNNGTVEELEAKVKKLIGALEGQ